MRGAGRVDTLLSEGFGLVTACYNDIYPDGTGNRDRSVILPVRQTTLQRARRLGRYFGLGVGAQPHYGLSGTGTRSGCFAGYRYGTFTARQNCFVGCGAGSAVRSGDFDQFGLWGERPFSAANSARRRT